jgi:hypothetical protein
MNNSISNDGTSTKRNFWPIIAVIVVVIAALGGGAVLGINFFKSTASYMWLN